MRFANLSQEATQCLWDRWKELIQEILIEFNEDVFHGHGIIRANSYREKSYLLLETKSGCLYIFPMRGDEIILRVYRNKLDKEALNMIGTAGRPDQENIVGTTHLVIGLIEERYPAVKAALREYLGESLRRVYKKYWMR